ncbi:hypothetical protein SAMN05421788_103473 [Filimonas lacunae]|uniref:SprB repeat-containing protein n=1 Tax=Filimonas lacunae TaxID=477680 RepID=A0A173MKY6_9BACT|nr:hypothetical protein [Filimonas lacunae]BAV08136.1 hypothetical protein FLA_4169 [Filimonas lacunae]SIT09817.1 hypothetical protein SAMN05421788_103473 [Filimonas lacunae]
MGVYNLLTRGRKALMGALLLFIGQASVFAQCDFGFYTTVENSACYASGKITVTLTGGNTSRFTSILYSIDSETGTGYHVSANPSPVFENVPPGTHTVTVQIVCDSVPYSQTSTATVGGNYQAVEATVAEGRRSLSCGGYGQAVVTVTKGLMAYQAVIVNAPQGYTGATTFSNFGSPIYIDSLVAGEYSIVVKDRCGTATSPMSVTIHTIDKVDASMFYIIALPGTNNEEDCSVFYATKPEYAGGSVLSGYTGSLNSYYAVSLDGIPKSDYVPFGEAAAIHLPEGVKKSDTYDKNIYYHIRPICGDEIVITSSTFGVGSTTAYSYNCNTGFDIWNDYPHRYIFCYPMYLTVRDSATGMEYKDTAYTYGPGKKIKNLPFGKYYITTQTGDGYYVTNNQLLNIAAPETDRYYVSHGQLYGQFGNDGACYFFVSPSQGLVKEGTKVEIIGNGVYGSAIYDSKVNSGGIAISADSSGRFLYPGEYVLRVTDECGVYEMTDIVTDDDVYKYTISLKNERTCDGLTVTPSGTCRYQGQNYPVYFQLTKLEPWQQWGNPIPTGQSWKITAGGTYNATVGAVSNLVNNYTYTEGGNVAVLVYNPNPVMVDVNKSGGYVCPRDSINEGKIRVTGKGGLSDNYTFKLAAQGTGATGPYWATNTTGEFNSMDSMDNAGTPYILYGNMNYDVQITDTCGASSVQTIKIIELKTAQIASSDKQSYCIGDPVKFSVINLPSTAKKFTWTGPDYFRSEMESPSFSAGPNSAGTYHVVINSDACQDPIEADIPIAIYPFMSVCYSAVTDTVVNPYLTGMLGNWHTNKSYVYYSRRAESDPLQEVNLRKNGTYAEFSSFWSFLGKKMNVNPDKGKWVWNAASTLFNNRGAEIENKDPLGRYNAGLYGYAGTLPTAVVQNARYRESVFEGFEDYGFFATRCDNACATGRHFDFSGYAAYMTTNQSHTGKYSLLIPKDSVVNMLTAVDAPESDDVEMSITLKDNSCVPSGKGLEGVRTTSNTLLPVFKPVKNTRVLFSAWVKEAVPCKGLSYTGSQIELAVGLENGTAQSVIIYPKGNIIEGWQRFEQVVDVPATAKSFSVILKATGDADIYVDDIRIHPYLANMKSFAYDPVSLRLMAELDENNYATFYEYDDDGTLVRVKKETARGISTIKETRSALLKEN